MVTWIRPDAPAFAAPDASAALPLARAVRTESGLRLGLLDNSKSNADHLLKGIAAALAADGSVASVVARRKQSPAIGALDAMLDDLVAEADLVLTAMAD